MLSNDKNGMVCCRTYHEAKLPGGSPWHGSNITTGSTCYHNGSTRQEDEIWTVNCSSDGSNHHSTSDAGTHCQLSRIGTTSTKPDLVMRLGFQPTTKPSPRCRQTIHHAWISNLSSAHGCWLCWKISPALFHQAIQGPICTCEDMEFHCCSISPLSSEYAAAVSHSPLLLCNGRVVQSLTLNDTVPMVHRATGQEDKIESYYTVLGPSECLSSCNTIDRQPHSTIYAMVDERFLVQESPHRFQRTLRPRQNPILGIVLVVVVMMVILVVALVWWRRFQRHRLYQQLNPDNHDLLLTIEEDGHAEYSVPPPSTIPNVVPETR